MLSPAETRKQVLIYLNHPAISMDVIRIASMSEVDLDSNVEGRLLLNSFKKRNVKLTEICEKHGRQFDDETLPDISVRILNKAFKTCRR